MNDGKESRVYAARILINPFFDFDDGEHTVPAEVLQNILEHHKNR
jgi:hypothetical protein